MPRIVLLDCSDDVIASLRAADYDLAVGYTGYFAEHSTMEIPSALHERDLLVVDLDPGWTPRPPEEVMPLKYESPNSVPMGDHAREPRRQAEPLKGFAQSLRRGGIILCLMEGVTSPPVVGDGPLRGGSFDWLPLQPSPGPLGVGAQPATTEVADDQYLRVDAEIVEQEPELAALLASPVQAVKSLRTLAGVEPLLLNESDQAKAGIFNSYGGGVALFLPYFQRKPAALHRLIGTILPMAQPELFPARKTHCGDEDAYQMPAVVDLRNRRKELEAEHQAALAALDEQEAAAVVAQRPFTDLLRAQGEDLHPVVRDALAWLGFEVTDHDADRKAAGGRLEEDLQVKDGAYFAVVEITSSRGNAKDKDFMDLEKYRTWRAKSPRRADVDAADLRGILIVNQMYREEPARREPLYASSRDMDWPEHARETGITLVSTWDLFKLIHAVARGDVAKQDARTRLQQPGLFVGPAMP